jgi:hypothetical protein
MERGGLHDGIIASTSASPLRRARGRKLAQYGSFGLRHQCDQATLVREEAEAMS